MPTTLKPLFDQLILTNNRSPLRYRLLAFIRREHIWGDAVRLTAQGRDYYHQHMQADDSSA